MELKKEYIINRLKKNDYSRFNNPEEQYLADLEVLIKEAKMCKLLKNVIKREGVILNDEEKQFIMTLFNDEIQEEWVMADKWQSSTDGSAEMAIYQFFKWIEDELLLSKEDLKDLLQ